MRTSRSPFHREKALLRIVRNDDAAPDVLLYDEIGYFGIQAKDFVPMLNAIAAPTIHLRINSPGGDVFDGIAIANAIRAHPADIIVHVDALAASIASIIAIAGDEVRIAENAFLMIHDPWMITMGNAAQIRDDAARLEKVGGSLIGDYVKRTGATEAQVIAWMGAETWFDADEAVEAGFADAVDGASDARASFDLDVFAHAPAALAAEAPTVPTIRECERALRDAGLSRTAARQLVAAGYPRLDAQRDAAAADVLAAGQQLIATLTSR